MIFQIFNKKYLSERGAMEFVESSFVFSIVFLSISLLFMISFITIVTVRDGEVSFNVSLEKIYDDEVNIVAGLKDSSISKDISLTSYETIFGNKVETTDRKLSISRIDTEGLLRKVDLVDELIGQIESKNDLFSKVKSKISQYKSNLKELKEIKQ